MDQHLSIIYIVSVIFISFSVVKLIKRLYLKYKRISLHYIIKKTDKDDTLEISFDPIFFFYFLSPKQFHKVRKTAYRRTKIMAKSQYRYILSQSFWIHYPSQYITAEREATYMDIADQYMLWNLNLYNWRLKRIRKRPKYENKAIKIAIFPMDIDIGF